MELDQFTGRATYRGWPKGVDNRAPDHDVPDGALRDAVNVDIRTSGKVVSRKGVEQMLALPGAHSIYADDERMVWADADTLYMCREDLLPVELLTNSLLSTRLSYVTVNGEIFFSNEYINGKITAADVYAPWGIAVPTSAPTGSGTTVETLDRLYNVACTFVTATGEESGAGPHTSVLCGDTPTIRVSNLPQPTDSRVTHIRVYVTNIDGKVYYRQTDVPVGLTSVLLSGFFANGAPLRTQFNSPPPPGQLLTYLNGIIYIASGNTIWHTEPLNYNLADNAGNFFMHSQRITLLTAVPDGLYVSSEHTYFYSGVGTDDVKRVEVLPYKAVEGAAMRVVDTTDVMWFSERGFVRATKGGQVKNLTEDQLAVPAYTTGAMGTDVTDGHQSVVALLFDPVGAVAQSADYTAETA